ncbi:peptide-binding protein [Novimethylophilus kurashikiensis]|uniref:Peptide-binding protein n=1 Tax=Novimethylophilus kurashikiensis TaxID=1825523 RepID=A0A2R5FAX6_9PROT|nr:hypothetical protein [Novimethylophilus kurashikiensis]GBG15390.1 peptide-binding protein [Novimethylophilus kurashikiensis]
MSKAKPLFSDKETEAEFSKWCSTHVDRIEWFSKLSDKAKILNWALAEFWYGRVNAKWDEALELVKMQGEIIASNKSTIETARKNGALSALLANWDKIQAAETQKTILDNGRMKGTEARQKKAKSNHAVLEKAINDLFSAPDKPGWQWSNGEITQYILKHHHVYAESTVKQKVKILAAQHRKNRIKPDDYRVGIFQAS